jgi:hypothetical protein
MAAGEAVTTAGAEVAVVAAAIGAAGEARRAIRANCCDTRNIQGQWKYWECKEMTESSDYEGEDCKESKSGNRLPQLLKEFQRAAKHVEPSGS